MESLRKNLQQHVHEVARARPGQFIAHRAGHFYTEQGIADGWLMWVSNNTRRLRELDPDQVEQLYLDYRHGWLDAVHDNDRLNNTVSN